MRHGDMVVPVSDDRLFDLVEGAVITVSGGAIIQDSTSGDENSRETPKVLRLGRARGRFYVKTLDDIPDSIASINKVGGLVLFTVAGVCPGMKIVVTWVEMLGGNVRRACSREFKGVAQKGGPTQAALVLERQHAIVPGVEPITGDIKQPPYEQGPQNLDGHA